MIKIQIKSKNRNKLNILIVLNYLILFSSLFLMNITESFAIDNSNIISLTKNSKILDTINIYPDRFYNFNNNYYFTRKLINLNEKKRNLQITVFDFHGNEINKIVIDSLKKIVDLIWFKYFLIIGPKNIEGNINHIYTVYDIFNNKQLYNIIGYQRKGKTIDEKCYFQKKKENSIIIDNQKNDTIIRNFDFIEFDGKEFREYDLELIEGFDVVYTGLFTKLIKKNKDSSKHYSRLFFENKLISICNYNSYEYSIKDSILVFNHQSISAPEIYYIIFNGTNCSIIEFHKYDRELNFLFLHPTIVIENNYIGIINVAVRQTHVKEYDVFNVGYIFNANGEFIKKVDTKIIYN